MTGGMTPDEYEDIAYECNRELGQAEQREIDRRVERALSETQQPRGDRTMSEPQIITPEYGGEEVTCPNCGRDHIPDDFEGRMHETCVECLDGDGDDE